MSTSNITGDNACACCGKESDNLQTCSACKSVKYCGVMCQKSHRPKHKMECKKRAAEIFDEALFKQPPPRDDCPICFLTMPRTKDVYYQSCCGKQICYGCIMHQCALSDSYLCPFCRAPVVESDEEKIDRCNKRMGKNDPGAFSFVASAYLKGDLGLRQNTEKALELWSRAIELGDLESNYFLGGLYSDGQYMERNPKKALYHLQQGAMGGCERSRLQLGCFESNAGRADRATKHFTIAAAAGCEKSLNYIRADFQRGLVTKDQYLKALLGYQKYQEDVRSEQRDRAAALPRP